MKKKLIILFSKYIKLRDTNESGRGNCCYCGRGITFYSCEAAHFITCGHEILRFNEINVNISCITCNRTDITEIYRAFMIKKYGIDRTEAIESIKNDYSGKSESDYADMYIELRKKAVKLASEKNFKVNL